MENTLRVLLFSVLRQKVGRKELVLPFEAPMTGVQLVERLAARYPAIGEYRSVLRLAVNQEYVAEDVSLSDGDEVALITPVSGG